MHPYPRTTAISRGRLHRFQDSGSSAGVPGPTGPTGPTGPAGVAGESAYEAAVAAGFAGSEAAWLESLIGPAGQFADTFETVNRNLSATDAATTVDADGVIQSISYAGGVVKSFTYDDAGRVLEIELSGATPTGIDLKKTFTYNGDGSFDWAYS